MQIKKRLYSAFVVILLTASSLLIFICLNLFSTNKQNPAIPVPQDALWVMSIDLEKLLKQEAYNTIFGQKDDQLLAELRKIGDTIEKNSSETKNLHIDLKEDCVLFGFERDNKKFIGIVLKTKNARSFNKHFSRYQFDHLVAQAKDNHAVIVTQLNQKDASKSALKDALTHVLHAPLKTLQKAPSTKNEFLTIAANNSISNTPVKNLKLSIQFKENKLIAEGDMQINGVVNNGFVYGLKSEGLHIYSRLVPKSLADTLRAVFPNELKDFADIESFVVDFQGTSLEDPIDSLPNVVGFMPVPVMNLIVKTKSTCDINELWRSFPQSMRKEHLKLHFGNISYQLKQLNANTYFVGVNEKSIIPYNGKDICFVKGTLTKMTKIYGSTFVTAFIENMGPMKAINDFLKSSDQVDIQMTPKKGKGYQINGSVTFIEGKHPIHQLTKLGFALRQLAK